MREALLRRGRSQWHAVQHDLIAGRSQQQPGLSTLIQRRAQFFPGSFELRRRPHVPKFV